MTNRIAPYDPSDVPDDLPPQDHCGGPRRRTLDLHDYSHTAAQRGWGAGWPSCTGATGHLKTITTARSKVRVTVHEGVAELALMLLDETERRGYLCKSGQTGGYNCRNIAGTSTPSNHSWSLAIDINWQDNPYTTNTAANHIPSWMPPLWNRYGFAWGGNYTGAHDFMHFEFMGTPAEATALTVQARQELRGDGDTVEFTDNDRAMLTAVYQYVTGSATVVPQGTDWPGWPTWPLGTDEHLTATDYHRRANVQLMAIANAVDALRPGRAGALNPQLSAADVNRIAAAVVALQEVKQRKQGS